MSQAVSPKSTYLTFEEYLAYNNGTDARVELVNGVLVETPPESNENLGIARKLLLELIKYFPVERVVWGTEIEVTGRRATCRLPDLLVHTEEFLAGLAGTTRATITREMPPPALVIEVVSSAQANRDRDYRYKHTEYAARGIAEYWIVDPETQQITVCRWVNGLYEDTVYKEDEQIHSEIITNFVLSVAQIWV